MNSSVFIEGNPKNDLHQKIVMKIFNVPLGTISRQEWLIYSISLI